MKAAIYARKSTDQFDRNEENKSVTRQVQHAKAYAKKNDWTVDEDHIFVDDAISGAEFVNRPGLLRMLKDVKDYDVIVMSDLDRFGRDQVHNGYYLAQIQSAGVAVHLYLPGTEMKFDSATDRFIASVLSFGAELEREKTGQRTRDALASKARAGYSTGGRCYGYDNVPVELTNAKGEKVRSHTNMKINEAQANVVRNIFRMYADGYGFGSIAKTLNGNERYKDQLQKYFGGVMSQKEWYPVGIRPMLHRRRYIGIIEFGRRKKVRGDNGRANKRIEQPQDEVQETLREDLRIIGPALWERVQKRLAAMRANYVRDNKGQLLGRPEQGRASKYLLSGLGLCKTCGGKIVVVGGRQRKHMYYACSYRINRGVCNNDHRERMEWIDAAFLNAMAQKIRPEELEYVAQKAVAIAKKRSVQRPNEVPAFEQELREERRKLKRFIDWIAEGDTRAKTVRTEIKQCEQRIEQLQQTIASYPDAKALSELDLRRYMKRAREMAPRFQEVLQRDPPAARQILRKLLRDERDDFVPVLFTPIMHGGRKSYNLSGQLAVGKLFNIVGGDPWVLSC